MSDVIGPGCSSNNPPSPPVGNQGEPPITVPGPSTPSNPSPSPPIGDQGEPPISNPPPSPPVDNQADPPTVTPLPPCAISNDTGEVDEAPCVPFITSATESENETPGDGIENGPFVDTAEEADDPDPAYTLPPNVSNDIGSEDRNKTKQLRRRRRRRRLRH